MSTKQSATTAITHSLGIGKSNQVEIIQQGAIVNSFKLWINDTAIDIIKGFSNQQALDEQLLKSYNSTRLAPFPNRIADGKYSFKGKTYQLAINFPQQGHALHGFMADAFYELHEQSTNKLILVHQYDGKHSGYPFPFRSEISYHLENNKLSCTTKLMNTGKSQLPYAEGWHPYFQLGGRINDWHLRFPSKAEIEVDHRMIPNGRLTEYSVFHDWQLIKSQKFDTCFVLSKEQGIAKTSIQNPKLGIQVDVFQETGDKQYNYMQLFTPNDRQSLAIEPMTCIPDVFNNGIGLIQLAPKEELVLTWGIEISII